MAARAPQAKPRATRDDEREQRARSAAASGESANAPPTKHMIDLPPAAGRGQRERRGRPSRPPPPRTRARTPTRGARPARRAASAFGAVARRTPATRAAAPSCSSAFQAPGLPSPARAGRRRGGARRAARPGSRRTGSPPAPRARTPSVPVASFHLVRYPGPRPRRRCRAWAWTGRCCGACPGCASGACSAPAAATR